ncbi:apolipoprotein N-acyltransferase [Cardinium endosymbiont of Culicoides punctatus]|uniref:apolipoprotein N-acyltransferase n=1 Tax=Cardinium endosymbiont of Culicoides punctatus TaxID=2304601 RepID=UPI0010588F10|nr:apolipoprotein N-acyltransferase [Cardinium endosymbiont of Culicoides punctatus]TDG95163.1 Apolipoprotein N-acyltransferase [Cardinium endosymbiont of Culicoides punctatus]
MHHYAAFVQSIFLNERTHISHTAYLLTLSVLSSLFFWLAWCSAWFGWLLCVAIVPILLIVRHYNTLNKQKSFLCCFFYILLTLFFWNCVTIWWISNAAFAGFIFVALYNTICLSIPWIVYYYIRKWFKPYIAYIGLVTCWLTLEHAQLSWESWEFTFPWLNLGNGLAGMAYCIQWYAYTGILGGSLWILVANIISYHILFEQYTFMLVKIFFCWLFLPLCISLVSYYNYSDQGTHVETVAVQPNFDSYTEKSTTSPLHIPYEDQIDRLLSLSQKGITPNTCLVAWPESAIDCCLEEQHIDNYVCIQPILKFLKKHNNLHLISGASSYRSYDIADASKTAKKRGAKYIDYFNSVFYFTSGKEVAIYHKTKRLPCAEYIPYFHLFPKKILSWIKQKFAEIGDIDPCLGKGDGSKVFKINHQIKAVPINCYESIYGAFVGSAAKKGGNIFVVVTNDNWWGNTPIYHYHFQYSRLLAIAHRKSVIRAANTGICGFINQRGDIIAATKPLEPIAIRQVLQANDQIAFYTLYGDYIGYIASYSLLLLMLIIFALQLDKKPKPFL